MLTSVPVVQGGVVPGAVGYNGLQGNVIGAPLGASGVYGGVPIGTTNQFYTQGYNQGLFGCNSCPWWVWLIIGFVLIASLIGLLAAFFCGDDRKERRRRRRERRREQEEEEGNAHYSQHLRAYY